MITADKLVSSYVVHRLQATGVTQTDISYKSAISYPRVNRIMNGRCVITMDELTKLSPLIGLTPNEILNEATKTS
jgi:plasmid maintenance system antidote protein VapI